MRLPTFVCLSVCWQGYSKTRAWKCCVSTDIGTRTNWLTFEPDPDYSPDAGTGLFLRYRISAVREILRRENPTHTYWPVQRGVVLKWFYSLRQ